MGILRMDGCSLVTARYGKYLIKLSYVVILAENLSHTRQLQIPTSFSQPSVVPLTSAIPWSFSFLLLRASPFPFPISLMSLGSSWSYAKVFFLDVSGTVSWRSAVRCLCENSGAVFLITVPCHEPISNVTRRNPGLQLTAMGVVQYRIRYVRILWSRNSVPKLTAFSLLLLKENNSVQYVGILTSIFQVPRDDYFIFRKMVNETIVF